MGTDIHGVIERRGKNGRWHGTKNRGHKGGDLFDRNYYLFGALAGVRRGGPAPKGLPDDAAVYTRRISEFGEDQSAYHSHSWYTLEGAADIYVHNADHTGMDKLKMAFMLQFPVYYWFNLDPTIVDTTNYRFVFWFDN